MRTRFVAYDRNGARRGVLPHALQATPVIPVNDLATLTLTYDRLSPKHHYLDNDPEIAFERLTGDTWVEIPNGRFRAVSDSFDHLQEIPTRDYEFVHVGEVLSGLTVFAPYGRTTNDEGSVQWKDSTPGRIIFDVLTNAKSRGWVGFTIGFSATHDSAGAPWAQQITIAFDQDTTLSSLLHRLVSLGMVDYDWQGRTLRVYNPDDALARDMTLGANPITLAGTGWSAGIDAAPESTDSSNLATHVVVIGEEGRRWIFPTGWVAPEGRREVVLSYSGVDDEGTARILANPTITKAKNVLKNTTRQFHLTDDTKILPFEHYRPGDWVRVQRGTAMERLRIRAVSLQMDSNGTQGFVTLGDKIDDLLEQLYEQVQRMTGGAMAQGTGTPSKPAGPMPNAPTDLDVVATAYVDNEGATQGLISLNFLHDGLGPAGEPVSIDYFPVWYRPSGTGSWRELMRVPGQDRAATYSPLPVYNSYKALMTYDFQMAAMSSKEVQSGTITVNGVQMVADSVPPPRPTRPIVSNFLMTRKVAWDGWALSASNVTINMPPDLHFIEVWGGPTSDAAEFTLLGIINQASFYSETATDPGVTWWYNLRAVDHTGNMSEFSDTSQTTADKLVDAGLILDKIDAAEVDLVNIDASVSVLADTVLTRHLLVTEDMTVKLLSVHKILATEIDVNSLTADEAFMGTLRAGIISADSITGEMIQGTALDGMVITGATIQTSNGIGGFKVTSSALSMKTASGANRLTFDVATGALEIWGSIFANGDITGSTITGSLFQTSTSPQRGIKISSDGLLGYNNSGTLLTQLDPSGVDNLLTGTFRSAPYGTKGIIIFNTTTANNPAIFFSESGGATGSEAALFMGSLGQIVLRSRETGNPGIVMQGRTRFLARENETGSSVMSVTPGLYSGDPGSISITGTLSVSGSKNFIMEHPTKPGWKLLHGATESPVSGVEYWGAGVVGNDGAATVEMPDYFEGLVKGRNRTVFVVGQGEPLQWSQVTEGYFTVWGNPGTHFSWLVKAERIGGDFEAERITSEEDNL